MGQSGGRPGFVRKGWADFWEVQRHRKSFWLLEAAVSCGGSVVGASCAPPDSHPVTAAAFVAVGGFLGLLAAVAVGLTFASIRAPFKQRNEAEDRSRSLEGELEASRAKSRHATTVQLLIRDGERLHRRTMNGNSSPTGLPPELFAELEAWCTCCQDELSLIDPNWAARLGESTGVGAAWEAEGHAGAVNWVRERLAALVTIREEITGIPRRSSRGAFAMRHGADY